MAAKQDLEIRSKASTRTNWSTGSPSVLSPNTKGNLMDHCLFHKLADLNHELAEENVRLTYQLKDLVEHYQPVCLPREIALEIQKLRRPVFALPAKLQKKKCDKRLWALSNSQKLR